MGTLVQERQFLTVRETAERLRLSEKTVRRLIAAEILPSVRVSPGAIRIEAGELDGWLDLTRVPNVSDDGSQKGQLRAEADPAERRAPESLPAVEAQAHAGGE
jgi:excisionase family DNA binding protein